MTRAQQIEKLEALLGRILARSGARAKPPAPETAAQANAPATEIETDVEWPTRPPPAPPELANTSADGASASVPDADTSAAEDRSVAQSTPPGDIPPEGESDSRERLVSAPHAVPSTASPEPGAGGVPDAVALADATAMDLPSSDPPPLAPEQPPLLESEPPCDVEPEQPPVSSRRPVGPEPEEQIARIAFGTDAEPPRHTPPPESGQLPTPTESDVETSLGAAPALEGFEASGDMSALDATTGIVRPPPPRLVVLETHAALPADGEVADMTDAPPFRQPETFVQLLQASLTL